MTQRTGNSNNESNIGTESKQPERIVDFTQVREKRLEEKRRRTERIFFKNLISVYSVTGPSEAHPIELIEMSEDGCSFQTPFNTQSPWPTRSEQVPIRLYFSRDTFLEIFVKIQNSRPSIENGKRYTRYGCSLDKEVSSYPAYLAFVRFLRLYSEQARRDMGDVSAFYT
jgi:hypothetical protein